jgi:hypothetical protein
VCTEKPLDFVVLIDDDFFFSLEEFIRFALNQEGCRQKWLAAVLEAQRLQVELEKANENNSLTEGRLAHARNMLAKERKKRLEAEGNSAALVRKLRSFVVMCPCVLSDTSTKAICVGPKVLWMTHSAKIGKAKKAKLSLC